MDETIGKQQRKAIAILNRGDEEKQFTLHADKLGIDANSRLRDLWLHNNLGTIGQSRTFTIPKHGIIVLKVHQ